MLSLHNFKIIAQLSDEEQQQFVQFLHASYIHTNIKLIKIFSVVHKAVLEERYEIEEIAFIKAFPEITKNKQHFYDAISQL